MEKNRQRKSEFIHVKDVLSEILRNCRKETHTELAEIRKIWNAVLDKTISDNAQPTALKGSVLLVTVKSSTLTHQLRFLCQDILQNLNRRPDRGRITEIKMKTGTF